MPAGSRRRWGAGGSLARSFSSPKPRSLLGSPNTPRARHCCVQGSHHVKKRLKPFVGLSESKIPEDKENKISLWTWGDWGARLLNTASGLLPLLCLYGTAHFLQFYFSGRFRRFEGCFEPGVSDMADVDWSLQTNVSGCSACSCCYKHPYRPFPSPCPQRDLLQCSIHEFRISLDNR